MRQVFLAVERLMIGRSRVVIVIRQARWPDTVREIDPDARPVLIENAPDPRPILRRPNKSRDPPAYQLHQRAPVVLHGDVRSLSRPRSAVCTRWLTFTRRCQRRDFCWWAANPIRSNGLGRKLAPAGIADVTIFAGERPADEIPVPPRL